MKEERNGWRIERGEKRSNKKEKNRLIEGGIVVLLSHGVAVVLCGGISKQRQTERQRQVQSNTPLPELLLLLGEQFFCLVAWRLSFIQGKICLARVGLGGSEEEDDVEEEELDDLLGADLEDEEAPLLPPGC